MAPELLDVANNSADMFSLYPKEQILFVYCKNSDDMMRGGDQVPWN
jgi:hypothetical protein